MRTEVEKARAKTAYDAVQKHISKRDLNSDNIFEDFISEKAFNIERVS